MPLVNLLKKNTFLSETNETQQTFDQLRLAVILDIVLPHYNVKFPIVIEIDASNYVSAGILSPCNKSGILRPIFYYSKKHNPAKYNYEIYDGHPIAIVRAFRN